PRRCPADPSSHAATRTSLFCFLTITQPPPSTTLFPYTTLFRSVHHQRERDGGGDGAAEPLHRACAHEEALRVGQAAGQRREGEEDRKSTRLNSSHGSISYAVFCLKKKKNKKQQQIRLSR